MTTSPSLTTLGELRLEDAGGQILPGRRTALLLLAYLARARGRPVRRELLATLLWGHRRDRQARDSLRQELLRLRRALPRGLIIDDDTVTLEPDALELDARAFEERLDAGDLEAALALWRGEFLPGAEALGDEPFRTWLEAERASLRSRLTHALSALVDRASDEGQWDEVARWAHRWCEAAPLEQEPVRRLVRALALGGQVAEAEAAIAAFGVRLGADPALDGAARGCERRQELDAHQPRRAAPTVASAAIFTPPLVGREEPRRRLADAWRAVRDGAAATVIVEGAEGLGKTRLVEETIRWIRHENPHALVLQAQAWPEEHPGEWGVSRDLLAGLAGAQGLGGAPEEALAEAALLVPAIRDRFRQLPPAAGTTGTLPGAVLRVLSDVAEEHPVVLVLDDAAGADPATCEFLLYLARRLPPFVLLLLALDPRDVEPGGAVAGLRRLPTARRLQLQPLSPGDVEEIVASMFPLPQDQRARLAESLHAWADGNPFYITQLVSALADRGALPAGTGDPAEELTGGPALPLPERGREAVRDRLARLSDDAHTVLEAAAVLAHGAEPERIAAMAGLPAGPRLTAALDELIARRFLRPPGAGREGYTVSHAMLRRTLLDLMGPARLQALHGAAGAALPGPADRAHTGAALVAHDVAGAAAPRPRRRALRGAALALTLIVVLGAALATSVLTRRGAAPPPGTELRVAVFPFALRGPDVPAYLAEGMVDLLSVRLDGPGGLRAASPQAVLALGGPFADGGPSVQDALRVARGAGAGLVVMGSVLPVAGGLDLQAALHDEHGERIASAHALAPVEDSLPRAVDELARQLLAGWAAAAGEESVAMGAPTTSSLPALKHYLEGERHFRAGHFSEALGAFREAVAHDSMFAMAYYRMTVAAEWIPAELGADTLARAAELSALLPRRSRLLIEGVAATRRGDFDRAGIAFRQAVQDYPQDREIRLQQAELYFHSGPLRPEPLGAWLAAFDVLEQWEPADPTVRLHQARAAAVEGDTAAVLRLTGGLEMHGAVTDRRLVEMAALRFLVGGRDTDATDLQAGLAAPNSGYAVLVGAAIYGRDYGAMVELVRSTVGTSDGRRANTPEPHVLAALLEAGRGRWRAAWREVDQLASFYEQAWLTTGAVLAIVPGSEVSVERVADLRTGLRAWRPRREIGGAISVFGHAEVVPEVREYLLGSLALLAGDVAEAELRVAGLEEGEALLRLEPGASPHSPRLVRDLAGELRGRLHLVAGRHDEAVKALGVGGGDLLPPQYLVRTSPLYARAQMRYLRGVAEAAHGERDSPLRFFESQGLVSPWEAPLVAPALIERARIHELLGDRAHAARLYLRAADIWKDADPEVLVRAEAARRKAEALVRR